MTNIAVVGLGKLGLPIAAAIASRGFDVAGVDVDAERVSAIGAGRCPLPEPGLEALLAETSGRLSATTDLDASVRNADVVMIFVPTPSREDGSFSVDLVLAAARSIGVVMAGDERYRVVVVNSTVSPGATMSEVRSELERSSGRTCGDGFGLCYSPEFVALGNVIVNFLRPDVVLIGESDERAGDVIESLYRTVCENDPPFVRMGVVNAEIAKLAVNTYVTTKIAFANLLTDLCGRVPGGNVDDVTTALGMDSRIGSRYLKGGLGYGGPCFPRDNRALSRFARSVGVEAGIPEATHSSNVDHASNVADEVRAAVGDAGRVAVLGLAYRANTDVLDESPSIGLAEALARNGAAVTGYDPLAGEAAAARLGDAVEVAGSLEACLKGADVVVIAMPWAGIEDELLPMIAASPTVKAVIDAWRTIAPSALPDHCRYVALGIAPRDVTDG